MSFIRNDSDDFFDLLEECAATTSKKKKLEIVTRMGPYLPWLKLALDTRVVYGIASLPQFEESGALVLNDDHRLMLLDLAAGNLSGGAADEAIAKAMRTLTPRSQQVLRRVILKDLRCGVGKTLVNEAFPGTIKTYPYMRCSLPKDSNEKNWNWADGIYIQLKADGQFANVDIDNEGVLEITTRQGTPYRVGAFGRLEDELLVALKLGTRTMGELTVYRNGELLARKDGNGILNSIAEGGHLPPGHAVHFDAWDQIPLERAVDKGTYSVPYKDRLADLTRQIGLRPAGIWQVRVIETFLVHSKAEAMQIYRSYLAKKLEGVIAKHPDAIWKDGDSKDQVKFKLAVTVDLRIKGFRPGTPGKRTEATFGAVECETIDGLLEVGVSGFKRDMEQYIHENRDKLLGTVMAVTANGIMEPSGEEKIFSLFSPRFTELRRDKLKADSLDQVLAQFEQAVAA
jgi:DNA ligase-1